MKQIHYIIIAFLIIFASLSSNWQINAEEDDDEASNNENNEMLTFDVDGELCDPTSRNPCESKRMECVWDPDDMLYKCQSRALLKALENYKVIRLEMMKTRRVKRSTALPTTASAISPLTSPPPLTSSPPLTSPPPMTSPPPNKISSMPLIKVDNDLQNASERIETDKQELAFPKSQEGDFELDPEIISRNRISRDHKIQIPSYLQKKLQKRQQRPREEEEENEDPPEDSADGTYEVPKYEGLLTWDGKSETAKPCIAKWIMAENLQSLQSLDTKKKYIQKNKDSFCDFERFFHCTEESTSNDGDLETEWNGKPQQREEGEAGVPTCRCYDTSMPIVGGRCYIPAEFGEKSSCGADIIAPYPIQAWEGAPTLRPRCTPNSDCKPSPYYFGRRCTCRWNVRWNPQTHTCDKATKLSLSYSLPFLSILFVSFLVQCLLN